MTTTTQAITIKLPAKHAADWRDRVGGDLGAVTSAQTERTITLTLDKAALRDLIEDADFYIEAMGPDDTGDIDYRPAARRCLAALRKQGYGWRMVMAKACDLTLPTEG